MYGDMTVTLFFFSPVLHVFNRHNTFPAVGRRRHLPSAAAPRPPGHDFANVPLLYIIVTQYLFIGGSAQRAVVGRRLRQGPTEWMPMREK